MKEDRTVEKRAPFPPFNEASAKQKVRMAEDGWNRKNPQKIALAYTKESRWRNRDSFIDGRAEIESFLSKKFETEHEYRLCKELWAYTENKIAVRFAYEWHNNEGQWFRSYGNENWEFDENGLMKSRFASINDVKILKSERKLIWDEEVRPENYPNLNNMNL